MINVVSYIFQDKTHCPFHIKTGVCRFGINCSRVHVYPDKSCTLLIKNMYNGPGLPLDHDEGLEVCYSFLALSSFISAWCYFTLERLVLFSLNHNLRSTLSTTPSTRTSSYGWGDIRQSVLTLYPDYVCLVYGWILVYIVFIFLVNVCTLTLKIQVRID
mgnify:CR=1 FL=1